MPSTLLQCYKQYTKETPIFLDSSMTFNYWGNLSLTFMKEIRVEAYKALSYIHGNGIPRGIGISSDILNNITDHGSGTGSTIPNNTNSDPFQNLFLTHCRFWKRYDAYIRINLKDIQNIRRRRNSHGTASPLLWGKDVHDIGDYESISRGLVTMLNAALGDRVTALRLLTNGNGEIMGDDSTSESGGGGKNGKVGVGTKPLWDSDENIAFPIQGVVGTGSGNNNDSSSFTIGSSRTITSPVGHSPTEFTTNNNNKNKSSSEKDNNENSIVIGVRINQDTCHQLVNRGPPADDANQSAIFTSLWGKKAQIRRFKDGAIIYAVVWNENNEGGSGNNDDESLPTKKKLVEEHVQYSGGDASGGIVERIIRHIVSLHFLNNAALKRGTNINFSCGGMMSLVDGCATTAATSTNISKRNHPNSNTKMICDSMALHKNIMSSFDSLSKFLQDNSVMDNATTTNNGTSSSAKSSKLGLPLEIDGVEGLSPCLRYAELFPPLPHPLLGGGGNANGNIPMDNNNSSGSSSKKISGVVLDDPIVIQIRFEISSKWPTDIKAMGAAKCAMLMQLAEGIEKIRDNDDGGGGGYSSDWGGGPINVSPSYLEFGFQGFVWRVIVRADQELKMLKSLQKPSPEAILLRQTLTHQHVLSAVHHSSIHSIHTKYPSSSYVTRLAKRWIAAHMLSDLIPHEALELLVASVYTNHGSLHTPCTVVSGFMRFLNLVSSHDWVREPLIIDTQGQMSSYSREDIVNKFQSLRGADGISGPPMYIVSNDYVEILHDSSYHESSNNKWIPSFTRLTPERVVLSRICALANQSYQYIMKAMMNSKSTEINAWKGIFQENPSSMKSYSFLLRVNTDFVVDSGCSSSSSDFGLLNSVHLGFETPYTRTLIKRLLGPKQLRKKAYKNLNSQTAKDGIMYCWKPVESKIDRLRSRYGQFFVLFYNKLSPELIAVLWRPSAFLSKPFNAINSELKHPIENEWNRDSLVITNADDIFREISYLVKDLVVDTRVFDGRVSGLIETKSNKKDLKRKLSTNENSTDEESD